MPGEVIVSPVGQKEARRACRDWHYSRSYPAGVTARYGVWEGGRFIGAVVFGTGTNPRIGAPYGVAQGEVMELVRVALDDHKVTVSRVLSLAMRSLRVEFPSLRMLVSYADPVQGHLGGIYQAGNWIYSGTQNAHSVTAIVINGEQLHERTCASRYGTQRMAVLREIDPEVHRVKLPRKHVYLFGLDKKMRRELLRLGKGYPKCPGK